MDAVEVDRVRVRAVVLEPDAERVALGRADHRPGAVPLYVQAGNDDARRDLEVGVDGGEQVLAHAARSCRRTRGG